MMIWQDQPSGTEKEGDCFKVPPWTRLEETAGRDAEAGSFVVVFFGGKFFFTDRIVPYAPCMGRFTYICHKCIG